MTLAELRDKADAKLATFWTALVTKEEAYFAKHGRYFQLRISPETPVVDGVDSTFTVRPATDEPHTVDIDFSFETKIPFNIEVHEGNGDIKEFVAHVEVQLPNGDRYRRSRTSANVDTGWFKRSL